MTGEWIEISLPCLARVGAYSIAPIVAVPSGQPVCFALLGYDDAAQGWVVVDDRYATQPFPVGGSVINVTDVTAPDHSVSRFRLIVTRVRVGADEPAGRVSAIVGQLRLFGAATDHSLLALRRHSCLLSARLGVGVADPGSSALAVAGSASVSGRLGVGVSLLGTEPAFTLQLSKDSAAKPSSSTWTVSSDRRLKEGIVSADLARCYEIVRKTPLRRFRWRDDVYADKDLGGGDRSKLGWIAQEVRDVFPKAVTQTAMFGLEDCLALNNDQLIAALYGCVQMMQARLEALETGSRSP